MARGGQGCAELLGDAGLEQDVPVLRGLPVQYLTDEVLGDGFLCAGEPGSSLGMSVGTRDITANRSPADQPWVRGGRGSDRVSPNPTARLVPTRSARCGGGDPLQV